MENAFATNDLLGSPLIAEVQKRIEDGLGFGWTDSLTIDTYKDFFQAAAKFLSVKKNKDRNVILELRDLNGGFHLAATVSFLPQSETGADEGSWALNFTFDESDVDTTNADVYNFSEDAEAMTTFHDVTYMNSGISWRFRALDANDEICEGSAIQIICLLIDALVDFMKMNVTTNPILKIGETIEFKSEAAGQGNVYVGITPGATLKQLIKSDASIGVVSPLG